MIKSFERMSDKLPYLITGAVVLLLGVAVFVVVNITVDVKSTKFYAELAFGLVLQIVMIATWVPQGKADGFKLPDVVETSQAAQDKMKITKDNDKYELLAEFCKEATAENRYAYVVNACSKIGVNYDLWQTSEEYRSKFPKQDRIQRQILGIERKSYQAVQPIKDTEITSVTSVKLAYDVKNHTGQEEFWRLFAKILTSVVTSVVGSFFLFENASFSLNGLMKFVYWLAIIGMTIFYSIRTGRNLISGAHKDYLLRMIDFLDRYKAWLIKNEKAV